MKRIRKAFGSVGSKKKTMKALRILETYKTTLHMYSIGSARPTPSTANIQSFRYIPARKSSYFVGREEIIRQPARHLEDTTVTRSDRRTVCGLDRQGGSRENTDCLRVLPKTSSIKHIQVHILVRRKL